MYHNNPDHIENRNRLLDLIKIIKKVGYEKPYRIDKNIYKYLSLAHSWKYIKKIKKYFKFAYKNKKIIYLDEDTYVSPYSYLSCFSSVLASIKAIDLIDKEKQIFIPTRPPGHHVGKNGNVNKTQGFCIFNNVAISAMYARKKYKTLILDIDIHHGNGTEDIVKNIKNIYFISTFAKGIYPYKISNEKYENVFRYPLDFKIDDKEYIELFEKEILKKIEEINPNIILVSLGFDMHYKDPLSVFKITLKTYKKIFENLLEYKTIYFLEGGYNRKVIYKGFLYFLKVSNSKNSFY